MSTTSLNRRKLKLIESVLETKTRSDIIRVLVEHKVLDRSAALAAAGSSPATPNGSVVNRATLLSPDSPFSPPVDAPAVRRTGKKQLPPAAISAHDHLIGATADASAPPYRPQLTRMHNQDASAFEGEGLVPAEGQDSQLQTPRKRIIAVENNLSGSAVGYAGEEQHSKSGKRVSGRLNSSKFSAMGVSDTNEDVSPHRGLAAVADAPQNKDHFQSSGIADQGEPEAPRGVAAVEGIGMYKDNFSSGSIGVADDGHSTVRGLAHVDGVTSKSSFRDLGLGSPAAAGKSSAPAAPSNASDHERKLAAQRQASQIVFG